MDSWPRRLAADSSARESALIDLRSILLRGLRAGLSGRAGSDEAFLQDVVQIALVKIVDRLDTFEGRSKFESWAFAIAFRSAYNELRRKEWKNVSLEELQTQERLATHREDGSPGPDEEAERRSVADVLQKAIKNDLTERQREVLLCELRGMPQEEIARQLGTNRNNIYKIFHDARRALRRSLESRGFDREFFFGVSEKSTL